MQLAVTVVEQPAAAHAQADLQGGNAALLCQQPLSMQDVAVRGLDPGRRAGACMTAGDRAAAASQRGRTGRRAGLRRGAVVGAAAARARRLGRGRGRALRLPHARGAAAGPPCLLL